MNRRWSALGSLIESFDHRRVPVATSKRKPGPFPYYGASGVVDYVDDYLFNGEYLLISEDGENLRSRSTSIAFTANGRFWVNNHAHVVKGIDNIADTRFLAYALAVTDISGSLSGSAQPKLSQASMNAIQLLMPPIEEQHAIAEVLGALDDKIAANSSLVATLEERLHAVFRATIQDGSATRSLHEVLELNPPRLKPSGVAPEVPMQALPSPGITIGTYSRAMPKGGARFINGDTLLARITPCLENGKTGYVGFLESGEVGYGSTEYIVMRSREGYPLPLSYFIATDALFRREAIQRMVGSSGRQRLKASDIADLMISITDDADRISAFGAEADKQFPLAQSLTDESNKLAQLRDTLLPALMDGRLRVRDAIERVEGKL